MVIHTITVNRVEHALSHKKNGAYLGPIIQHGLGVQLTETAHPVQWEFAALSKEFAR